MSSVATFVVKPFFPQSKCTIIILCYHSCISCSLPMKLQEENG